MRFPSWLALSGLLLALSAQAGEPWLAPGDRQARHDLQLLVDEGVIDMPVSGWPIAVSDIAGSLSRVDDETLTPAQAVAVKRMRLIASEGRPIVGVEVIGAVRPSVLRTFDDEPREEGEFIGWASGFFGSRWGGRLEVRGIVDADDQDTFRIDGTYVAGKFGNWIVTLGEQDRWWGSGWQGSLILSNSARPVPAIALDRAESTPFETKWLSWIGPWRLSTFMGYMEAGRKDVDHPLLFGFRVSARPLDGLEISIERAAQWCGEGRSCDWNDFWNLWWGNDNAGENVNAEDEPGNQLAGWDIRWASPIGDWNYALYNQHTGETIDNQIPRPYRSMDIAGLEFWGTPSGDGRSWRGSLEWANTRCGGTENGQTLWDCAYNNNIFNVEGYRSKGHPLGHSMDGDGETWGLRYMRFQPDGRSWTTLLRYSKLNQGGVEPDTRNVVAPGAENWWSLDVTHHRPLKGGWIEASVGADYEDREWNDTSALLPRFAVSWTHEFQ